MTPPRRGAEDDHESDVQPDPKPSVALSREQQRLYSALLGREEKLGAMYFGGLQVLHDAANPDRVAQSAHSMRELMEKFGELGVPPSEGSRSTKVMESKVFNLKEAFARAKRNSEGHSEADGWMGPFDGHLRRFLNKLCDFFDWMTSDRPLRRTQFDLAMSGLDASGRDLPKPLRDRRYKAWKKMVKFFQNTSHHSVVPSLEELRELVGELEAFLTKVLLPTTSDDLNAIDALLKESGDA